MGIDRDKTRQKALRMYQVGVSMQDIAKSCSVSRQTVNSWCRQAGLEPRKATETRICSYCSKEFIAQKRSSRKFCPGCYYKYLKEHRTSDSYNSMRIKGLSVRQWQRKARDLANSYIKLNKEFRVHHIDGDITNNDKANLFVFYSQSKHLAFHHRLKKDSRSKPKATDGYYIV